MFSHCSPEKAGVVSFDCDVKAGLKGVSGKQQFLHGRDSMLRKPQMN